MAPEEGQAWKDLALARGDLLGDKHAGEWARSLNREAIGSALARAADAIVRLRALGVDEVSEGGWQHPPRKERSDEG